MTNDVSTCMHMWGENGYNFKYWKIIVSKSSVQIKSGDIVALVSIRASKQDPKPLCFNVTFFLWANTFYCILICLRLLQNLLVTLQCCLTRLSSVKWYWYFLRKWYWCWYWEDRLDGVIRGGWQPIVLGSRLMFVAWLVIGNFSKSIELFVLSLCWYFSILCK